MRASGFPRSDGDPIAWFLPVALIATRAWYRRCGGGVPRKSLQAAGVRSRLSLKEVSKVVDEKSTRVGSRGRVVLLGMNKASHRSLNDFVHGTRSVVSSKFGLGDGALLRHRRIPRRCRCGCI